jgi:hypothetical protein
VTGSLRILNWNFERRLPASWQAAQLLARTQATEADIICLTEAHAGSLDDLGGHVLSAAGRVWSKTAETERKVLLWSPNDWSDVVYGATGTEALVSGMTITPLGPMRITGVCIPYHMAAPMGVTPRPKPWSIHLAYLQGLQDFLAGLDANIPSVIAGDFNQRIPRSHTPHAVHDALLAAINGYRVATGGVIAGIGEATIDHIAFGPALSCAQVFGISNIGADGKRLSDHFGVAADLHL